jgi:hypothetical protein
VFRVGDKVIVKELDHQDSLYLDCDMEELEGQTVTIKNAYRHIKEYCVYLHDKTDCWYIHFKDVEHRLANNPLWKVMNE